VNISKHLSNGKKMEIIEDPWDKKKRRRDKVMWQDRKIKKKKKNGSSRLYFQHIQYC